MRITIEPTEEQTGRYDCRNHSVTVGINGDDLTAEDVVRLFEMAMLGFGYHPDCVNEALGE